MAAANGRTKGIWPSLFDTHLIAPPLILLQEYGWYCIGAQEDQVYR